MLRLDEIAWTRTEYFFEAQASLYVPVFQQELDLSVDPEGEAVTSRQFEALQSLLALSPDDRQELTHRVALNCQYACLQSQIDGEEPPVALASREEVWHHLSLSDVVIPRLGHSADLYVFVSGNCAWEEEHGLELLFKNGMLFGVGPQNGLFINQEWTHFYINE